MGRDCVMMAVEFYGSRVINMENIEAKQDLQELFTKLGTFGRQENNGMTRLSWSPEFKAAQEYLRVYMEANGMAVELDAFGNLIGIYEGKEPELEAVCCGSHLDTVPNGGAFDGALGIVCGLSCVHRWYKAGVRPRRTVKIIAFAEEEGTLIEPGCMGSAYMMGELVGKADNQIHTVNAAKGKTLQELVRQLEITADPLAEPQPLRGSHFIELHIEQGQYLEEAGLPLGIVSAIVGIKRFTIGVEGKANHAGTTRMEKRHDAVAAMAPLITYLHEQALAAKGAYVATVGHISVFPNVENVVPGSAEFSVEIRAEKMETVDAVKADFMQKVAEVCEQYKVKMHIVRENNVKPVLMAAEIMELAEGNAQKLGVAYQKMPSWAGHDAMIMAKYMPTAMLFVPSKQGISHAPEEWSDMEHIEHAVQVLSATLWQLAEK